MPAYLFFRELITGGDVLDICPQDPAGPVYLSESGSRVYSILPDTSAAADGFPHPVCSSSELPFAKNSVDLVVSTTLFSVVEKQSRERLLKEIRRMVSADGVVALVLPNRQKTGIFYSTPDDCPDYWDFERMMRRHFPHITILSQKPLAGSVLEPMGRSSVPDLALNDSLLDSDLEEPSHYIAVCSSRYRRINEQLMARFPFSSLEDSVAGDLESMRSALEIARREAAVHSREIPKLRSRAEELEKRLMDEEERNRELLEMRNKSEITLHRLEVNEKALGRADVRIKELESDLADTERNYLESESRVRRQQRELGDLTVAFDKSKKEGEQLENERLRMHETVAELQSRIKTLQRKIDDSTEQLAGIETDREEYQKRMNLAAGELRDERERRLKAEHRIVLLEEDRDFGKKALEENLEKLRRYLKERDDAIEARREAQEKLDRFMEEIEKGKGASIEEAEGLRIKIAGLNDEIENLKNSAAAAREETAQKEAALIESQEENKGSEGEIERLKQELAGNEQEIESLKEELEGFGSRLEGTSDDLEKARQKIMETEKELADALGELEKSRLMNSELQDAVSGFEVKVSERDGRIAEMEKNVSDLRQAVRESVEETHWRNKAEEARKETASLRQELETFRETSEWDSSIKSGEAESKKARDELVEKTKFLESEVERLKKENEVGLLAVREDVETELRLVRTELDTRDSELWEAREEIIRLRAQLAATIDDAEHRGEAIPHQKAIEEQEKVIHSLTEERNGLIKLAEKTERSLARRKSHINKLIAILKHERVLYRQQGGSEPVEIADEELDRVFGVEDSESEDNAVSEVLRDPD